jgi:hypothetical protein
MRKLIFAAGLILAACTAPSGGGATTTASLVAADASTSLAVGERITADTTTHAPDVEGADPLVTLTLRHADGRAMSFQEANHAPNHVMAQAPGGALAQIMGLFGEEAPVLYVATENSGAPFVCGAEGPVAIGVYEAADGQTQVVGLQQEIEFDTRPDGQTEAIPYSPDLVCARLRFQRG